MSAYSGRQGKHASRKHKQDKRDDAQSRVAAAAKLRDMEAEFDRQQRLERQRVAFEELREVTEEIEGSTA